MNLKPQTLVRRNELAAVIRCGRKFKVSDDRLVVGSNEAQPCAYDLDAFDCDLAVEIDAVKVQHRHESGVAASSALFLHLSEGLAHPFCAGTVHPLVEVTANDFGEAESFVA